MEGENWDTDPKSPLDYLLDNFSDQPIEALVNKLVSCTWLSRLSSGALEVWRLRSRKEEKNSHCMQTFQWRDKCIQRQTERGRQEGGLQYLV